MKAVKPVLKLSKARQRDLARLKSPAARQELIQSWTADAEKQAAKNQKFLAEVKTRELEFGLTPRGAVFIKNTGTRYSFLVITPERAKILLFQIAEFTSVLEQAGDREVPEGSEE